MSLMVTATLALGLLGGGGGGGFEIECLDIPAPQTLTTAAVADEDLALPLAEVEAVEAGPSYDVAAAVAAAYDVAAAVAAAYAEIGTARPTGWAAPGECIESARRWVNAGGGAWTGSGTVTDNYVGAERLENASQWVAGDVVQYEYQAAPHEWVAGVHTVLIVGVNDDGTFRIVESNNPGGSGLVTSDDHWSPAPPAGFQAVGWRF